MEARDPEKHADAEPASTSLRKCMPRIMREPAIKKAAARSSLAIRGRKGRSPWHCKRRDGMAGRERIWSGGSILAQQCGSISQGRLRRLACFRARNKKNAGSAAELVPRRSPRSDDLRRKAAG